MSSTGATASRSSRLLEHRGQQLVRTEEGRIVSPVPGMRSGGGRVLEQRSRANPIGDTAFRLGQWRVDPAIDEISRDGTTVKLEPRTMRVLVCLAEHAGDIVSVNQLLDTVWKDLVVTVYSVYQAVAVLRRALGDDPKDPTYIASVVRRGYRLVAPVSTDPKLQDPAAITAEPSAAPDLHPERVPAEDAREQAGLDLPDATENPGAGRRLRYGSILVALLVLTGSVSWCFVRLGQQRPAGASAARSPVTLARVEPRSVFTPPPHSVAVLPFSNLSGDPKQEYFADGMSEELINALAQINALKVIARTSSFSFKDKDADITTIGRKLNVAAILEGSVRRSGSKVRITVQLIAK